MGNLLQCLPKGARVLIIRLRSLGDCVLATPGIEILKKSRPDLDIGIVVENRFAGIFEGNPDLADLLCPEASAVARWRARLCLNLHGGPRSALLTAASLAPLRAGFAHFRHSWLYNVKIPTAQQILDTSRKVHTAEHVAAAMFHLGAERVEIPPARLAITRPPPVECPPAPYAVLHPFASAPEKTWPAERFLAVARALRNERRLEPVFIGGPDDDFTTFSEYRTIAGAGLAELKALIRGASLFAGNDSGPAHIASALGVPVLVIFSASDPVIWGPWKPAAAQVIVARDGIEAVSEAEVLSALEQLRVAV